MVEEGHISATMSAIGTQKPFPTSGMNLTNGSSKDSSRKGKGSPTEPAGKEMPDEYEK